MARERKLTASLFCLICTTQRYRDFLIDQSCWNAVDRFEPGSDWGNELKRWFFQIPVERLKKHGLAHNELSLQAVLDFKVTPEMIVTEYGQLGKFKFVM